MTSDTASPDSIWDVILVGGGMGGAAVAERLTRAGQNVLLLEKGVAEPQPDPMLTAAVSGDAGRRLAHGYWPTRIAVEVDAHASHIWPQLGSGLGGSTNLYAATLGRLEPEDFEARTLPDGSRIGWPFGYKDLEPYYLEMERRFEVCGTADPLRPDARYDLVEPPAMSATDRHFFECMQAAGLHPYRLHNAVRYERDGTEQKLDARSQLLAPALATGRLTVQDSAEVLRVEVDRDEAQGVTARVGGKERQYRGRVVVLAAGALNTPLILQRSANGDWPDGLGNRYGLVGRNLMFHASDFVAVWPRHRHDRLGPTRAIALRDFYQLDDAKLGEFQSMGLTAGYGEILTFLHQRFDTSALKRLRLLRHFLRIPAWLGAKLFHEATVFTTIVEDYPYPDNRVVSDPDSPSGFRIHYVISDELRGRVQRMRAEIRAVLKALRVLIMNQEVSLNFGHSCGTCRAGDDPRFSVVDRACRVHGTRNVYVVDGSIMPTSGGVNPSLTIAANAARVADGIATRCGPSNR